jgi:hypothetical protein
MFNLYVDDVRQAPDGWRVARTIADAKLLLSTNEVDACSLDHDMGACVECTKNETHVGATWSNWCSHAEDGSALVRWLIETGHWPKQCPTVHSMNPVGAKRMREDIARYFPYV